MKLTKNAIAFREELARIPRVRDTSIHSFWLLGDGSTTTFPIRLGYKPVKVFVAGLLVKEGGADQYIVSFNGDVYSIVFAVAPANLADIAVDTMMVVI